MNWKSKLLFLAFSFILISTSGQQSKEANEQNTPDHTLLMPTLYNYFAAEYRALAFQAFNIAQERLLTIRKAAPNSTNMAVVVDIDETIIDNTPFEAYLMLGNQSYTEEAWNNWCAMAAAKPVPGAVEFLNFADSLGFAVFYISNRKEKFTREGTIQNLQSLGFPQLNSEQILLRAGERDKEKRRLKIAEKYTIVMLVGDNIGDFYQDTKLFAEREETMLQNRNYFGNKFIVLPNSIYGHWPESIGLPGNENTIDSLLKIMADPYFQK